MPLLRPLPQTTLVPWPGKASISGGAASYSIPITLPPGRAGIQPGVSLNYSSNGGNGLMGQGWSLSAGGAVSRCGSTFDIDKRADAVQYTDNDKLCLNGQRLILINGTGAYGDTNSQYHPEMSPTTKVTHKGTYFEVVLPNGHTQTYSKAVSANGLSVTRSWKISKTEDLHGNTIVYEYDSTLDDGKAYLSAIAYTGDSSGAGNRRVEFAYEQRQDSSFSYHAGGKSEQTQRLSGITTKYDGNTVLYYDLKYLDEENSLSSYRKSLLHSIKQCFGGTVNCHPPTVFTVKDIESTTFGTLGSAQMTLTKTDKAAYQSSLSIAGDYDGDGKKDLVINYNNDLVPNNASSGVVLHLSSAVARCLG